MANNDIFTNAITAATPAGAALAPTANAVGAYVLAYGTHAGVTINFEGTTDGGTTWIALGARVQNVAATAPTIISAVLGSNSSNHYYVVVGACQQMRVRASAYTSGSLQVSIMPTNVPGSNLL
jgi:hypothetical protein